MFTPYIKDEWKQNIKDYRYKGGDISIWYVWISNPFCNWLIQYCPNWIAYVSFLY